MAIEGPLRELGLSELFQMLDLSRKTGVLTVRSDSRPHPASVHFDRGSVVGAELPGTLGRLGHILLRAGKITDSQMEAVLREQQAGPRRAYGAILVEKGWGTIDDVQQYLRFQVEETVFELIRWKEGYFRFEEKTVLDSESVPIRLSVQSLLMEAARRIDEWTTIEAAIPDMNVVPVLVGGEMNGTEGANLDLRPSEWEILGEIDGEQTIRDIAEQLGSSDFMVAKTVFGLVAAGVVEVIREPVRVRRAAPPLTIAPERMAQVEEALQAGEFRRANQEVARLIRDHPDVSEVYLLAGRASAATGRWREACEMLLRATQQDPLSAPAYYHLGFAAARTGDLSRAEEAWSTYLRLPDSASQHRDMALRAAAAAAELRRLLAEGAA